MNTPDAILIGTVFRALEENHKVTWVQGTRRHLVIGHQQFHNVFFLAFFGNCSVERGH